MKHIDGIGRKEPEPQMVERLQIWCEEWAIDQVLVDMPSPAATTDTDGAVPDVAETTPAAPLEAGCVALLSPIVSDLDQQPLHVLLLDAGDGPGVLCIPFGRFTEPATPGEMLSGFKADGLRVLCLWNARRLPSADRLKGWAQETIPAETEERCRRACAAVSTTGALPADLAELGGPPVTHPDDPRRIYLYQARQRVDRHLGRTTRADRPYRQSRRGTDAHLRAAEDRDPYGESDDPTEPTD